MSAIYEDDLSIKLMLTTNESLIFIDSNDPYPILVSTAKDLFSNYDEFCKKNTELFNKYIGFENYDLGHLLSFYSENLNLGIGGNPYNGNDIAVICSDKKAFGVSFGSNQMELLLAHELGHQFGAHHTLNNYVKTI
ncbi:MAG: hypothetical protein IPI11_16320 [Haliscomenobacter sp.]|nr:hypothetical protein [Haliscomenobacter sp.]